MGHPNTVLKKVGVIPLNKMNYVLLVICIRKGMLIFRCFLCEIIWGYSVEILMLIVYPINVSRDNDPNTVF